MPGRVALDQPMLPRLYPWLRAGRSTTGPRRGGAESPRLALLCCAEGRPPGGGEERERPAGPRFGTLREGLDIARKEYRPLLVLFSGTAAEGPFARDARLALSAPEVAKLLDRLVCVEVAGPSLAEPYPEAAPPPGGRGGAAEKATEDAKEKPPPRLARISERLGLVEGQPALLLVDFRERVARRWEEKAPGLDALKRELGRFAREMEALAATARKVEKTLEEAGYANNLGETREAVLLILPLDDLKARRGLDWLLKGRVEELITRLKKGGYDRIATGEALESERRYLEAVEVYRRTARDFPFPEIVRAATRRQGQAMRRAQGQP